MKGTVSCALALFFSSLVLLSLSCGKNSPEGPGDSTAEIREKLALSLHGTAAGIEHWYAEANGGLETVTQIPYSELKCDACHIDPDRCELCHSEDVASAGPLASPVQSDDDCYGCHGQQYAEVTNGLPDSHREAGMKCSDCHRPDDVHGDGNQYSSLHDEGAIDADCSSGGCHASIEQNAFHDTHAGDSPQGPAIDCAACHSTSVVTCYNCHFEYEVAGYGPLSHAQFTGWKFLVQREIGGGQKRITLGNFQTVTYQGKAFIAIAPFFAHTVAADAITDCADCHDNDYVQEYDETGKILIAEWNEPQKKIVPNVKGKGIIPVPPDWQTSLRFGFVTYDDSGPEPPRWEPFTPTEIGTQMLFAEPLESLPR